MDITQSSISVELKLNEVTKQFPEKVSFAYFIVNPEFGFDSIDNMLHRVAVYIEEAMILEI